MGWSIFRLGSPIYNDSEAIFTGKYSCQPSFNVDVIKLYVESEQDDKEVEEEEEEQQQQVEEPPPFIDAEGHERYVVEEALRHKFHDKKTLYLVKWVGYKDPTWEPEELLHDEEGREIIPLKHYLGNSSMTMLTASFFSWGREVV